MAQAAKKTYEFHRGLGAFVFVCLAIVFVFSILSTLRDIWVFSNSYPKITIVGVLLLTAAIWALGFPREVLQNRLFQYSRWLALQVYFLFRVMQLALKEEQLLRPRVDSRSQKRTRNLFRGVFAEICLSASVLVIILVMIFAIPIQYATEAAREAGKAAAAGVPRIDWAELAETSKMASAVGKAAEGVFRDTPRVPVAKPGIGAATRAARGTERASTITSGTFLSPVNADTADH